MSLWKKTMDYLGLGPDDAYDDYDDYDEPAPAQGLHDARDQTFGLRARCGSRPGFPAAPPAARTG